MIGMSNFVTGIFEYYHADLAIFFFFFHIWSKLMSEPDEKIDFFIEHIDH